jgi:polysaccharide chain length determinant protein (PEP-CTERM system associated)
MFADLHGNLNEGMTPSGSRVTGKPRVPNGGAGQVSLGHYFELILHRKWLVLAVFALVTAGTFAFTRTLPDVYMSETTVLVDPQKVPEIYVKSTVTGDVRNRLGTLSQQILSATRLQKIIDQLNLYPAERKTLAREDVILHMRNDINVTVLSDFNSGQDVQAFRITYSGREPRLVAQVTNELASLFMEENLKVREQQSEGTTEFLTNQMQETRKTLEEQEGKLKDFRLQHLGEMPEQEAADLQILGQLQSQLQLVGEALNRAESQKSTIQAMASAQSAPVVDMDQMLPQTAFSESRQGDASVQTLISNQKAELAKDLKLYTDSYPAVQKLQNLIAQEEQQEEKKKQEREAAASRAAAGRVAAPKIAPATPPAYTNPVLQSQLSGIEVEIAKDQAEQQRLTKAVASYQAKLESIPVREQEIAELTRDYEISKAHYSQLLNNQMNAETATQLEIRQKGEKFSVLDPAQPAGRPSRPNRAVMNAGGSVAGLVLGVVLALITEFMGLSITSAEQVFPATGLQVLEVIPVIHTGASRLARRRRVLLAVACGLVSTLAIGGGALYYYRSQIF